MVDDEGLERLVHFAPLMSLVLQASTFILAIITFVIVIRQLRTALRTLRLSTMMRYTQQPRPNPGDPRK